MGPTVQLILAVGAHLVVRRLLGFFEQQFLVYFGVNDRHACILLELRAVDRHAVHIGGGNELPHVANHGQRLFGLGVFLQELLPGLLEHG